MRTALLCWRELVGIGKACSGSGRAAILSTRRGRLWLWMRLRKVGNWTIIIVQTLIITGAKLSAISLSPTVTNQMWMMDGGILKMVTEEFYVGIVNKEAWAEVELTKSPKTPEDLVWLIVNRGRLYFVFFKNQNIVIR